MRKNPLWIGAILTIMAVSLSTCGIKHKAKTTVASTYKQIVRIEKETKQPTVICLEKKQQTANPFPSMASEKKEKKEDAVSSKSIAKKKRKSYNSMTGVMTTIALYMAEGRNYDPEVEKSYYAIMVRLANAMADQEQEGQFEVHGDTLCMEREFMKGLSTAAFTEHPQIGSIPIVYKDLIQLDNKKQQYRMPRRDPAEAHGVIQEVKENIDGSYTAKFVLITDEQEEIGLYEFTLLENETKYAAMKPNFNYCIQSVKKMTE